MSYLIHLVVVVFLLSSCGVVQSFEERMDDLNAKLQQTNNKLDNTNEEIHGTNKKLDDTKDGQSLGLALELMTDKEKSINMRAAAAETVFTLAKEDRIFKYLGAPAPLDRLSIPIPVGPAKLVSVPNVAYVGDAMSTRLAIAPIHQDLHAIQVVAAINLLRQLSVETKSPDLSAERLEYLRGVFARLKNIASVVIGGVPASQLQALLDGKKAEFEGLTEDLREQRATAAYLLRDIAANLNLSTEESDALDILIEARLSVSSV